MRLLFSRSGACSLVFATILAAPLAAQKADEFERITWNLGPATTGYCVNFLMDPKEALEELTGNHRPVPAASASSIHPALKRAIADEPTYADWVPSELCTYFLEAIEADGKQYVKGDKGAPLAITFWGVAVTDGDNPWNGQVWLRAAGSNSYSLARAMEVQRLPIEKINVDLKPVAGNPEDQLYITKFNSATIQFSGHFNPDTTGAAAEERKIVGYLPGPVQSQWSTTVSYIPAKIGTMSGSMQVFGSRNMAKALNRSPIRLVGPAFTGGSGSVLFVRTSTKKK